MGQVDRVLQGKDGASVPNPESLWVEWIEKLDEEEGKHDVHHVGKN